MNFEPTMHKLSNGITVILDPMDVATAELSVCFRTGGMDETPQEYGITHFCEHMFCKGTTRFPTARLANDYMADHGGTVNAQTGLFRLEFVGRIIAKNLNTLIDFTADRLQNSLFDQKVIENERGVIIEELRRALSRDNTRMRLFLDKSLFNLSVPDGKVVLGNPNTINSFTRDQILEFVSRRMSAHNCLICISGNIGNATDLLKTLEREFSFLPTHDVKSNMDYNLTPCIAHNLMPERENVVLEIMFPDLWPDIPENIYQNICFGKFNHCLRQKLFDVLRSENGLTYGVGIAGYGSRFAGVTGPRVETGPSNVARVVELTAKTAYRVYSENMPTDEDLRRYKNQNELSHANFLENNSNRCERLVTDWLLFDQMYDFNKYKEMSDNATNADVIKYTRGIFDGPISIITQGPKFDGDLKQMWYDNFK